MSLPPTCPNPEDHRPSPSKPHLCVRCQQPVFGPGGELLEGILLDIPTVEGGVEVYEEVTGKLEFKLRPEDAGVVESAIRAAADVLPVRDAEFTVE